MSEPDQIDMMDADELRMEFRAALRRIERLTAKLDGYQQTFIAVAIRVEVNPDSEFNFEDTLIAIDKITAKLAAATDETNAVRKAWHEDRETTKAELTARLDNALKDIDTINSLQAKLDEYEHTPQSYAIMQDSLQQEMAWAAEATERADLALLRLDNCLNVAKKLRGKGWNDFADWIEEAAGHEQ